MSENETSPPEQAGVAKSIRLTTPRLWPAWAILVLQVVTIGVSITPAIPGSTRFGFMMGGPLLCVVLFLVWLLAFSRLRWQERVGTLLFVAAVSGLASLVVDASMGVALWIYGAPLTMAIITVALWRLGSRPSVQRFAAVAVLLAMFWASTPLLRLDGFDGEYLPELRYRWAAKAETALSDEAIKPTPEAAQWTATTIEWPGFRGPEGNSRVANSGADLSWSGSPRVLWREPVGPAWSSFAHVSGRLFTQEQRDQNEAVTCLDAATGKVLWRTTYPCRFSDVVAGAGPRATPTFADGKLYTFGAKAILASLNAATGEILWQHDLMAEVNAKIPVWGFSSSPLIVGQVAIVYAGGDGDNGLMAFDKEIGGVVWRMASSGMNFASALRVTLAGQELVLFGDAAGLHALDPATGAEVWRHKPDKWKGPAICQPQQIGPNSLIVPLGDDTGTVRLEVTRGDSGWNIEERWVSRKLKPNFNDFVYHDGYCYGFDSHMFSCINAETGEQQWRHKGYGFGQVLLLADVGQLIVTTEQGETVLLAADPEAHRELGRYDLIPGKTWNHPIVADGRLFARNGEEMVAIALSSRVP